jgi:hypothetical protein
VESGVDSGVGLAVGSTAGLGDASSAGPEKKSPNAPIPSQAVRNNNDTIIKHTDNLFEIIIGFSPFAFRITDTTALVNAKIYRILCIGFLR